MCYIFDWKGVVKVKRLDFISSHEVKVRKKAVIFHFGDNCKEVKLKQIINKI